MAVGSRFSGFSPLFGGLAVFGARLRPSCHQLFSDQEQVAERKQREELSTVFLLASPCTSPLHDELGV